MQSSQREGSEGKDSKTKLSKLPGKHLAQSIPVLSLKNRQIPHAEGGTSASSSHYESLTKIKNFKNRTLETPMNRGKTLNKKN